MRKHKIDLTDVFSKISNSIHNYCLELFWKTIYNKGYETETIKIRR